jgi:hypothetical protein
MKIIFTLFYLSTGLLSLAQKQKGYNAIYSGIPWFDEKGNTVSAHGANIVKDKGRYYLFGEHHYDTSNAFAGFSCYSSTDLYNWKFESIALPVQDSGKLGPGRVGERPKVMKCPATGEYIMYMHVDTLGHVDQFVGYATSNNITGPYTYHGPLLFDGRPIRKWDMGTFQDRDGAGYVLLHGGDIYKLNDNYKTIAEHVCKSFTNGFESPAIFRKDSLYYFLGSHLTSWERNDNDYYTAASLKGPWIKRGMFCPEGSLTWNSQTTFVLPVEGSKETTYMFMGDRWSFPKQASAATYVWQPLQVKDTSISIPDYKEAWTINTSTGVVSTAGLGDTMIDNSDKKLITCTGKWINDTLSVISSNEQDACFNIKFTGTRIGFYGLARPDGGYARVKILNSKGRTMLTAIVDMYCKYPERSLKFLSPLMKKDNYTVTVSVMGEHGNWSDKKKNVYGSTGNYISLEKFIVNE